MSEATVLPPLPGEKRKRDNDDSPNPLLRPQMPFSAESDQYPWEKVECNLPKQTHLSHKPFEYYCELNEEAEKDDMVVVQGRPGLLILEGTKVVWNAAAKRPTDKLASTPIQVPSVIRFDVNEQTQIWQRVYKVHTMLRIRTGDDYRTMIFSANKEGSAALGRLRSIIEHKWLKTEAAKNVFETNEATVEVPPPEGTDRETVVVENPSESATQGAEQDDSSETEVRTFLAQDFAHEVPETAEPTDCKEQEPRCDASDEDSGEESVVAAIKALDEDSVEESATNLDKLSEDGSTEGLCQGPVELSGKADVDTFTERTAQESAIPTGEHDEGSTSPRKAERPCGCDDHGTDLPSEYLYERGEQDLQGYLNTFNHVDPSDEKQDISAFTAYSHETATQYDTDDNEHTDSYNDNQDDEDSFAGFDFDNTNFGKELSMSGSLPENVGF